MTLGSDGQPTGVGATLWLRPDASGHLPTIPAAWLTELQLAQKREFLALHPPSGSFASVTSQSSGFRLGVSRDAGWLPYYGAAIVEGLANGFSDMFVLPVVHTSEAIGDVGGLVFVEGYEPLNPHIVGMLSGERTWYGGTFDLLVDGLGCIPGAWGGRQVIRSGRMACREISAQYHNCSFIAYKSCFRLWTMGWRYSG
jgi:hypothetical protein